MKASCLIPNLLQVALVEQLLEEVWSGPAAVLLNADWATGLPAQYRPMADAFQMLYCFFPVSVKVGLLAHAYVTSRSWRMCIIIELM